MPGIENYFAKVPKQTEPARPRQASGRSTAGAAITTKLEKATTTVSTNYNKLIKNIRPSMNCDRNNRHQNPTNPHPYDNQNSSRNIDCEDDDVIIIEDLSKRTRPKLPRVSIGDPSKPKNELIQLTMQSKTDRRFVAAIRTPNVPKVKGSFFARKYREITQGQLTPSTPKLDNATPMRNRHRSGNYHPYTKDHHTTKSARSNRNQHINHDSIVCDYSTPTTTRTLLTPTSLSGSKKRGPTRFMYKPLELDNESSSESTDSIMRRHEVIRRIPQEIKAIEAPPPPFTSEAEAVSESPPKSAEIPKSDTQENVITHEGSLEKEGERSTIKMNEACQIEDRKLVSECITPPITPEKTKDESVETSSKQPTFIPGNCDIDEVLKMYGTIKSSKSEVEKKSEAN